MLGEAALIGDDKCFPHINLPEKESNISRGCSLPGKGLGYQQIQLVKTID